MTLLEAVKSGLPFKRPTWGVYYEYENLVATQLNRDNLLADDWEVKEEPFMITKSDFFNKVTNAYTNILFANGFIHPDERSAQHFLHTAICQYWDTLNAKKV